MNTRKNLVRISSIAFVVIFCFFLTSALAIDTPFSDTTHSEPLRYQRLLSMYAYLNVGFLGKCECSSDALLYYNTDIAYLTMELQRNVSGTWTTVATWTTYGNPVILEGSYYVKKGYDYRVHSTVSVYDADNIWIETVSFNSNIEHY